MSLRVERQEERKKRKKKARARLHIYADVGRASNDTRLLPVICVPALSSRNPTSIPIPADMPLRAESVHIVKRMLCGMATDIRVLGSMTQRGGTQQYAMQHGPWYGGSGCLQRGNSVG